MQHTLFDAARRLGVAGFAALLLLGLAAAAAVAQEGAIAGQVTAEVGLVSRKNMLCRMLLGRKTMEGEFVVDPSRAYLHGRRRAKRRKEKTR